MKSVADIIREYKREQVVSPVEVIPTDQRSREFYKWVLKVNALPLEIITQILQHKDTARVRRSGNVETVEATIEEGDGFVIDACSSEDKEKGTTQNRYYLWDNLGNKCYERKLI